MRRKDLPCSFSGQSGNAAAARTAPKLPAAVAPDSSAAMAENLKKQPPKGILKNSSSFDIQDKQSAPNTAPSHSRKKEGRQKCNAKWDEMNILATLHPPDKDYGHMKIDEPKTPYNYEGLDGRDPDTLDPEELAERIRQCVDSGGSKPPRDDDSEESDDDMTPEERAAKNAFENKRKKHYNEYYAVKLARKLLEKDEDEDEDEDSDQEAGPA